MRLTKLLNYLRMSKSLSVFTQEFSIAYIASGKDVSDCLLRAKNAKALARLVYDELYEKTELDLELEEMQVSEEIRMLYRGMTHKEAHEIAPIHHIGYYAGWTMDDIESITKLSAGSREERAIQTAQWCKDTNTEFSLRSIL